jgi:ribA/ribD-fused uncharacterized protein
MVIDEFRGRWFFLSNFSECKIEFQGIAYPTVEHYYVAMKSNSDQMINGKYYTSADFREMIAKIKEPAIVKKIGQQIKVRKDWSEKKLEFMNFAIREKFKDENLAEKLKSTGNSLLVENNLWKDTFWGVFNGKGENHLGKILMKVRDEINGIQKTGLEEILK